MLAGSAGSNVPETAPLVRMDIVAGDPNPLKRAEFQRVSALFYRFLGIDDPLSAVEAISITRVSVLFDPVRGM